MKYSFWTNDKNVSTSGMVLLGGFQDEGLEGGVGPTSCAWVFVVNSLFEKNILHLTDLANLSKSFWTCNQSNCLGVGTNEGPLLHRDNNGSEILTSGARTIGSCEGMFSPAKIFSLTLSEGTIEEDLEEDWFWIPSRLYL